MANSLIGAFKSGSATTPAAGAAIATLPAPAAGRYQVEIMTSLGGTLATLDLTNMELRLGAAVAAAGLQCGSVAGAAPASRRFLVNMDGSTAISVNATALATTGAVYVASIKLTPSGFLE